MPDITAEELKKQLAKNKRMGLAYVLVYERDIPVIITALRAYEKSVSDFYTDKRKEAAKCWDDNR